MTKRRRLDNTVTKEKGHISLDIDIEEKHIKDANE
jgi:hypothetical protein